LLLLLLLLCHCNGTHARTRAASHGIGSAWLVAERTVVELDGSRQCSSGCNAFECVVKIRNRHEKAALVDLNVAVVATAAAAASGSVVFYNHVSI